MAVAFGELEEQPGKHVYDDKAVQGKGIGPEWQLRALSGMCAISCYQKLASNPNTETSIGRWPVSRLFRSPAKSNLLFPPVRPCHAYANVVSSIIFLATALASPSTETLESA
jgi:hypothetical protein